jgi:hypothetical protein
MNIKAKSLILLSLLLATAGSIFAQPTNALTQPWSATVKVVGEDGVPIGGANVAVAYVLPPYSFSDDPQYNARIVGVTDTNGLFFATHNDRTGEVGFGVSKRGYYETRSSRTLRDPSENANDRDITLTLVLKKIANPIPMYAKWQHSEPSIFKKYGRPPIAFTNTVGYDLMVGDWVAPYGKGANTDVFITEEFNKSSITDYYYKLTISFPNAGDGIQEFTVPDAERGSALRSPHEAPADGYQPQLVRENFHHPGQAGKSDYDENRNYFFRVRTILDSNGNVKSALYGKIYGDPEQVNFRYYLNPTPNDRNIEFDPKRNLLGGLESSEGVSVP